MRIDVFSDVICPWCFVGKRRLERALAARPDLAGHVEIHWRAFQLNPDMPAEGIDRQLYLRLKFGDAGAARRIYRAVEEAGEEEGIDFDFEAIQRTPNTIDAHRLIRFAGQYGRQDALVERLFAAYFGEGENLGQWETLLRLGTAAGLPEAETAAFLEGDAETEAVRAEDRRARRAGITGVPCFVVAERYALPGAQPPEALVRLFDLALAEASAA